MQEVRRYAAQVLLVIEHQGREVMIPAVEPIVDVDDALEGPVVVGSAGGAVRCLRSRCSPCFRTWSARSWRPASWGGPSAGPGALRGRRHPRLRRRQAPYGRRHAVRWRRRHDHDGAVRRRGRRGGASRRDQPGGADHAAGRGARRVADPRPARRGRGARRDHPGLRPLQGRGRARAASCSIMREVSIGDLRAVGRRAARRW